MGSICDTLSDDDATEIKEAVAKAVNTLPSVYTNERKSIVEKMKQAAPKPYENLLHADYPDKNGSLVTALASKRVASDDTKKRIANEIYEEIHPKIDGKTADMDPVTRAAFRKTVEKAIKKYVDKAVDAFVKNIDKIDTQAKPAAK